MQLCSWASLQSAVKHIAQLCLNLDKLDHINNNVNHAFMCYVDHSFT